MLIVTARENSILLPQFLFTAEQYLHQICRKFKRCLHTEIYKHKMHVDIFFIQNMLMPLLWLYPENVRLHLIQDQDYKFQHVPM